MYFSSNASHVAHHWSLCTVRPLVKAALAPPTLESRIAASLAKSREEQIYTTTGDRAPRRRRAACGCPGPTAAFQARCLSITREQRWAVAAAAVTLSKRRDNNAQHCDSPAVDVKAADAPARDIGAAANSRSLAGNQGAAACPSVCV
jgi:hypothetical protein